MPRLRPSQSDFCTQQATEARRMAQVAETLNDFEFWSGLETKWAELAEWYALHHDGGDTGGAKEPRPLLH